METAARESADLTGELPGPAISAADERPGASDAEAIACAPGALVDSLLIHLRDRRLLLGADIDEICESAIRAHSSRDKDPLSARIVAVLGRMHADGTALRTPR